MKKEKKSLKIDECNFNDSCERMVNTCISIKILIGETKEYYEIMKGMRSSLMSIQKKLGSRILEMENKVSQFNEVMNDIKKCSRKKNEP